MMKTLKVIFLALLCCGFVMACGGDGTSQSEESTTDLSSSEQAELVAAALTAKEGGLGEDFVNIAQIASQEDKGSILGDLDVSADLLFYDNQGVLQEQYDSDSTDLIQYDSRITGNLSIRGCYFQEFNLDNQSNFTADELLSGVAIIDGTHHLHSSYARNSSLSGTEVSFSLDCDLTVTGVTVKMHTIDVIPDMGTVDGSIAGTYVRNGIRADVENRFNFQFYVTYMGNNTAEIQLGGDVLFSLDLETGRVIEIEVGI